MKKLNIDFPFHVFYSDGRIRCTKRTYFHVNSRTWLPNPNYLKLVKPRRHPIHGKLFVSLTVGEKKQKTIQLAQVIAQTFLKRDKKKTKVWFKDGNCDNVKASNLYWVDQGELNHIQEKAGTRNMAKQAAIMRKSQKSTKPKPCVLYGVLDGRKKKIMKFPSLTACAKRLNTSAANVSYSLKNKTLLFDLYYVKTK